MTTDTTAAYPGDFVWELRGVYDSPAKTNIDEVRNALSIIRCAGLQRIISQWAKVDREAEGKGPGGRKPFMDYEAVAALMLLLAMLQSSQTIRAAAALIQYGMDEECRKELGINISGRNLDGIYYATYRSYHRLLATFDPHPGPRRCRMDIQTFDALEAKVDHEIRRIRHQRADTLNNAILLATWKSLPRPIRRRYKGNVAVDGTFIAAFGKYGTSRKRDTYMGIEPYAGWWGRDGSHFVDEDKLAHLSKTARAERGTYRYGWEANLVVAASNDPKRQPTFPQLVLGISFDTPGASPGKSATTALKHIYEEGLPTRYVIGDRAYGNTPRTNDFQEPARAMGYRPVFDMKLTDLGKTTRLAGGVLLEGNLYCPSILSKPKLILATKHYRDPQSPEEAIDFEEFIHRIEARHRYLAQPNGKQRDDGSQRFKCPAASACPTLACGLRPRHPEDVPPNLLPIFPKNLPGQDDRGALCTNPGGDVTVGDHPAWQRESMDVIFASEDWAWLYQTLRQTIESMNRSFKHSGLDNPDRRRVRGFASAYFLITTVIAATNLRKAARWISDPTPVDARGRGPKKHVPARRRDILYRAENPRPWQIRAAAMSRAAPKSQVVMRT